MRRRNRVGEMTYGLFTTYSLSYTAVYHGKQFVIKQRS
ncbi:unnamed protein product [Heligmosomoides polygyrus]|uniref:Uncharacterized protein n=1 Tax=Heligmosomoides polygyrus TaxID=6339 RepID=A0A183G5Z8_HELPZ|nr:unnamed protein product [Heligmosomoides polygyrus]